MERLQALDFDHPIFQSYPGGPLLDKHDILINKKRLDDFVKKLDEYEAREDKPCTREITKVLLTSIEDKRKLRDNNDDRRRPV